MAFQKSEGKVMDLSNLNWNKAISELKGRYFESFDEAVSALIDCVLVELRMDNDSDTEETRRFLELMLKTDKEFELILRKELTILNQ